MRTITRTPMSYWKELILCPLVLAILTSFMGCSIEKPSSAAEMEKLQGTWQLVYQEMNGQKIPDEKTAEMLHGKMVFVGDKIHYTVELQGFDFEFAYKLHLDQEPKAIDLQLTDTVDKQGVGLKTFGIYLLQGDTLKICHSKTNRPIDFNAGEGLHNTLIVLKRKVADAK